MKLLGWMLLIAGAVLLATSLWMMWKPLCMAFIGLVLIHFARTAFSEGNRA